MTMQDDNKVVVGRWFTEFWGNPWNPNVVDELAAPDIKFHYSLHAPLEGRAAVKEFAANFRSAFPDLGFGGTADLIAEGRRDRAPAVGDHSGRVAPGARVPARSWRLRHQLRHQGAGARVPG